MNIAKVAELEAAGLMTPAGRATFQQRREDRSAIYSHEQDEPATFTEEQEAELRANPEAWAFWESQPPGYRRDATHWVTSAKKEETRTSRLATLVADSAAGQRIKQYRRR